MAEGRREHPEERGGGRQPDEHPADHRPSRHGPAAPAGQHGEHAHQHRERRQHPGHPGRQHLGEGGQPRDAPGHHPDPHDQLAVVHSRAAGPPEASVAAATPDPGGPEAALGTAQRHPCHHQYRHHQRQRHAGRQPRPRQQCTRGHPGADRHHDARAAPGQPPVAGQEHGGRRHPGHDPRHQRLPGGRALTAHHDDHQRPRGQWQRGQPTSDPVPEAARGQRHQQHESRREQQLQQQVHVSTYSSPPCRWWLGNGSDIRKPAEISSA